LALNQGFAPNIKEGFGNFGGEWQKPLTLTGSKNNYTHNA
jgi:hypothetical protein